MFISAAFVLLLFVLFLLGAVIGSFLNVVMYRSLAEKPLKKNEKWYEGRSRCDHCGQQIAWYDNIPLLSFLVLGGKCRTCHKPIGWHHLTMEILVGSLFVWWGWVGTTFFQLTKTPFGIFQPLFWLAVGILLVYILLTDAWYYLIPDTAVIALTGLTVVYRLALVVSDIMQPRDFILAVASAVGAVGLLGGLWLITKGRGMGLGDVKLMIPLGLLLGWPEIAVMLFVAFGLGGLVALGLIVTRKRRFGQVVPFGPFLIVGTCLSLVWGEQLFTGYLRMVGL